MKPAVAVITSPYRGLLARGSRRNTFYALTALGRFYFEAGNCGDTRVMAWVSRWSRIRYSARNDDRASLVFTRRFRYAFVF